MARHTTGFAAILAMVLCIPAAGTPVSARVGDQLARRSLGEGGTLDGVLGAYVGGDFDVTGRTFVRSLDFHRILRLDKPRELDRWLGSWDRGKAMLLLELARTSTNVAPHYVAEIVGAGRRYILTTPSSDVASDRTTDFHRVWHRAAVGLLQGASNPARVEEYVTDIPMDARLLLARAVAQERRCWIGRPSLDQPAIRIDALLATAGFRVPDDSVGPIKSEREAALARHSACLREAVSRFEAAARIEDVTAEALVRGGWILIQDGRPKEAIEWLEAAKPQDDRDLEYWRGLFRGRALEALARSQDAVDAYREALALYPRAQSAGLGLTIALMRLDRMTEADETSRSVRESRAQTTDPWLHYIFGDKRFAGGWIESLRTVVR